MTAALGSGQTGEEDKAEDVVEVASGVDEGLNAKGKARDIVEDEDSEGPEGEGWGGVGVVWEENFGEEGGVWGAEWADEVD